MEHQLFDHFFPGSDPESCSLGPLMDPLCTILYDALRPVFIQLQSLDELCGLVDILQHEVIATPFLSRWGCAHVLSCQCSVFCLTAC